MSNKILEINSLTKNFGGIAAVKNVDMNVERGSITAVIGPNGAGKTTLFNLIAGVFAADSGNLAFNNKTLNGTASPKRVKLGISRTFQQVLLFKEMTVLENIMVGRHTHTGSGFWECGLKLPGTRREEKKTVVDARHFLSLVGQGDLENKPAAEIPLGQQKLVAIARALAAEPQLLLLDEPGAGLNNIEKKGLCELIKTIRKMGITVLLVEHDMEMIMNISDWIVVLDYGQKISEGTPWQVQKDPAVVAAYLGE